jgi:hypothetical protein
MVSPQAATRLPSALNALPPTIVFARHSVTTQAWAQNLARPKGASPLLAYLSQSSERFDARQRLLSTQASLLLPQPQSSLIYQWKSSEFPSVKQPRGGSLSA